MEVGPVFSVRAWFADIWSHVWPVLCKGELLRDQRLQDLTHQPSAGAHTHPWSGPQWAEAQNQPVTVSSYICEYSTVTSVSTMQ